MAFNSAVNRYVELVDTKPHIIFRAEDGELSSEAHEALLAKQREFKRLFVEIGSGSGGHIIERAEKDPEALFVGIELRYKRVYRTAEKAEQRGLRNVVVIQIDAANVLEVLFAPESIDGLFVLFPDPWDKRRWKKHRIVNENFLASAHRLLKADGFWQYKTDHGGYFKETEALLRASHLFVFEHLTEDLHGSSAPVENVESEFEKLFKYKRLPIYMLTAKKHVLQKICANLVK